MDTGTSSPVNQASVFVVFSQSKPKIKKQCTTPLFRLSVMRPPQASVHRTVAAISILRFCSHFYFSEHRRQTKKWQPRRAAAAAAAASRDF